MNKKIKENITRIIGVILIIIGIIAFNYINWLALAFFIPAIIMILANKKLAQAEFRQFILTFKKIPEKKYFLITLYDTLSWFGLFFATYTIGTVMARQTEKIMPGIMMGGPGGIAALLAMTVAYFVVLLSVSVIIYSAFKGLIWLTILDKKIEWRYFTKFSLLNAIWLALWIIPALVIALGLKPDYFLPVVIAAAIIGIHLTAIMQYSFTKKQAVLSSLGNTFKIGIGKIKKFLLPYSYMVIVYMILLNIFWVIPKAQNILTFAMILILMFYMAWYRQYIAVLLGKMA